MRFLRFQLRDGDIGNCPTDNDTAHSQRFNKPYSERAEWRGPAFSPEPGDYELSFNVRFLQGFDQTRVDETFFQIKDCPTSAVPVMAKIGQWDTTRGPRARIKFELGPGTGNTRQHSQFISNDVLDGAWHQVTAQFYTGEPMRLAVQIDGVPVLRETAFGVGFQCGQPSLRIGIYRPGDLDGNRHSIVDYDSINITHLPNS
ncbi:hypothetical protein SLH49_00820 [Cognatiyoonia sp. IB215446]|uniref:hypothetical protein n=1 Tax=Cognatiyoonia sp. IB215446 TaxID=3097355 RepID=UPI002A0B95D7|nr:hypothetical protein [Cognatiyoonia sp. IB215446]MDX8346511.1 hypothetical protein [Cognatiyoonia sp. IB215446]